MSQKIGTILIAIFLFVSSISNAQEMHQYNSDVTFQIIKGDIWRQIASGDGMYIVLGRGYNF